MDINYAVYNFKSANKILDKNARSFKASVVAVDEFEDCIYDDLCECSFTHDTGYEQDKISVVWKLNNCSAKALNLYGEYNTRFQDFEYVDEKLVIHDEDNGITIYVKFKSIK